jgi:hypothetical protein
VSEPLLPFKALVHVPRVDEAAGRLTGGCVPRCPGCEQEAQVADLVAERDRYRDALERVYRTGRGVHVELARDALNG